jgi:hypothetical protein
MKTIRSKAVLLGLLGATAIGTTWVTADSANAGAKTTYDVIISDAGKYAIGSLADTRASGSNISYMQASVLSWGSDSWQYVHMIAKTGGNSPVTRECTSYDRDLVAMGASVKGDSYIDFGWDSAGDCTHIRVVNGSKMSPKVP